MIKKLYRSGVKIKEVKLGLLFRIWQYYNYMIINYLSVFIFFVVLTTNLNAEQNDEKIVLKNGQSYSLEILDIYSWGIKLSNNFHCMYKQISIINTLDSKIVNKIKGYLPQVKISKSTRNIIILDFNDVIIESIQTTQ